MLCAVIYRKLYILAVFDLLFLMACHGGLAPADNEHRTAVNDAQEVSASDPDIPDLVAPVQPQPTQPLLVTPLASGLEQLPVSSAVRRELYSVVADRVPVKEILQSIARDTHAKFSFVGELDGDITLSVVNQPLEFILDQISRQASVRYELHGERILLVEDKPLVRTYEVDYVNMQRLSESRVDLATRVGSMSTSIDGKDGSQVGSNGSQLFVKNKSDNTIWRSIVSSISGILGEKSESDSGSENVFVNKEAGVISVRAREAQHRSIETMLDEVIGSAHRQVLIEATVVEVTLSDQFESGVDWQVLNTGNVANADGGFDFSQILGGQPEAAEASTPITALLTYSNQSSAIGNLTGTLKLLQQFGDVQVLSSPKIIALNNQPAVLKVVDNRVYFTFEVDRMERENGDERTVVDSTVHSVPVGLVMNVTPFISKSKEIILNVRPTISRIVNFAEDPSPALAGQSQVRNLIPEIQVREMESLLRVQSGDIAIIGGLMQKRIDDRTSGVPGIKSVPLIGKLFSYEKRTIQKTELLVFLRPTVIDKRTRRQPLSSRR